MTIHVKTQVFALLVVGALTAFASGGTNRNTGIDLLKIATRFVQNYSRTPHKAGNTDGMFIEDVIIPSVVGATESYKGKISAEARDELYQFLIASNSMASEELSGLAANIYLASPNQFCRDVLRLGTSNRRLLIQQASDGVALSGMKSGRVKCD